MTWLIVAVIIIIVVVIIAYYMSRESVDSDETGSFQEWFDEALDSAADMVVPGARNRRQSARANRIATSHPQNKVFVTKAGRARKCTKRRDRKQKCTTL
jgi:Flp pilus assembly protein TadB